MDLIAKSNSMSTAELSQMKAELKLKQKVTALVFLFFFLNNLNSSCDLLPLSKEERTILGFNGIELKEFSALSEFRGFFMR